MKTYGAPLRNDELALIENAVFFNVHTLRRGLDSGGVTTAFDTLAAARLHMAALEAALPRGAARPAIYAVSAHGRTTYVPASYQPKKLGG